VARHVLDTHRISRPTRSLVRFIKDNTIREIPSTAKAG
jgi:hypothetical protein